MKFSDFFQKIATTEAFANVDIPEFDSQTQSQIQTVSEPLQSTNTEDIEKYKKMNEELKQRISKLEEDNKKLVNNMPIGEDEKTIEERIYDLCVPGHKKEVFSL